MSSLSTSSELTDLRSTVRPRARRSLSFLAQNVLGLRLDEARCDELQAGAEPVSPAERRALRVFRDLGAGLRPADLSPVEAYLVS